MIDLERRRALSAAAAMGVAAVGGQALVPTKKLSELRGPIQLDQNIPKRFADWRVDPYAHAVVTNPQTQALLDKIYTATLDRTYMNARGQRVMLAVAYGADQSDPSVQLHYPEICYPAQGFKVEKIVESWIGLPQGRLNVKRVETHYANQRFEPVTYWTMMGDVQSLGLFAKRLAELRHGLRGEIVDGVLIRVSSLDTDSPAAFALQDRFILDLVASLSPTFRHRLTGL
jgi:EpsI family protein